MACRLEIELETACKLLERASPEALEESARRLQSVAAEMAAQPQSIGTEEARRIREAARKARLLLDSAARFHSGWCAVLGGMAAGYTAQGSPADLSSARLGISGRMSVSG